MGRANADLSGWIEYFTESLAGAFKSVASEARRLVDAGVQTEPMFIRRLDRRARTVLALFAKTDLIRALDVAEALGLSDRMARNLLRGWTDDGWLIATDPSRKARAYTSSAKYRQYMSSLSAMDQTGVRA